MAIHDQRRTFPRKDQAKGRESVQIAERELAMVTDLVLVQAQARVAEYKQAVSETGPVAKETVPLPAPRSISARSCCQNQNRNTPKKPARIRSAVRSCCAPCFRVPARWSKSAR